MKHDEFVPRESQSTTNATRIRRRVQDIPVVRSCAELRHLTDYRDGQRLGELVTAVADVFFAILLLVIVAAVIFFVVLLVVIVIVRPQYDVETGRPQFHLGPQSDAETARRELGDGRDARGVDELSLLHKE